jgi:hypothetical protein
MSWQKKYDSERGRLEEEEEEDSQSMDSIYSKSVAWSLDIKCSWRVNE